MNNQITRAAELIKAGQLVAFPTETVYGLGANAFDDTACRKIYALKGRPANNPLIVHGSSIAQLETIAEFNEIAYKLAKALWPGPLTMVLPLKNDNKIADTVTAGLSTIAVRLPAHKIALTLIEQSGCLIAAPSANKSGYLSPTKAGHVRQDFAGSDLFILEEEGGCHYGLESTIIDLSTSLPVILRYGFITPEIIESVTDKKVVIASASTAIKAPGMLYQHYAPRTKLRINADSLLQGELGLNFAESKLVGDYCLNLSKSGDLAEAASNLFTMLHILDEYAKKNNCSAIAVAVIPDIGIGLAINDRLKKAANKQ